MANIRIKAQTPSEKCIRDCDDNSIKLVLRKRSLLHSRMPQTPSYCTFRHTIRTDDSVSICLFLFRLNFNICLCERNCVVTCDTNGTFVADFHSFC